MKLEMVLSKPDADSEKSDQQKISLVREYSSDFASSSQILQGMEEVDRQNSVECVPICEKNTSDSKIEYLKSDNESDFAHEENTSDSKIEHSKPNGELEKFD